nr:MAG TPA: hypothetical protein [Caudoviricetes sp.]
MKSTAVQKIPPLLLPGMYLKRRSTPTWTRRK